MSKIHWGRRGFIFGGIFLFFISIMILGSITQNAGASSRVGMYKPSPTPDLETINLPTGAQSGLSLSSLEQQAGKSSSPKLDSSLAELVSANKVSESQALDLARARGIRVSGNRVHVQIVIDPSKRNPITSAIRASGGEVTGVGNRGKLLQGWLPISALETIAAVDGVQFIRRPVEATLLEGTYTSEGVGAMNASAWHAAGYEGSGVKIGIIDGGFQGYASLLGTDLPASVTVKNFVDGETDPQVDGTTVHGSACAEVVFDTAPSAQLYLAKISTDVDLEEAVTWMKDTNHVDVISTSLGWYNLTPGDGSGFFADLVDTARTADIFWATAAGNDREAHWGGAYNDSDADNVHNFNGTQEINYFGPGGGAAYNIPAGYVISGFLRWDDWTAVNQDYDLYLWRWGGSSWTLIAAGTNYQNGGVGQTPTEYVAALSSGTSAPYGFTIQRYSSTRNVNLEFFAPKIARLDELVNARSLANLADSPNAMTVAAVDVDNPYPQESYSSEGPANGPGGTAAGGIIKPDISGYANVSGVSYGVTGFNGTSAATPHVAGAAALVLGANPGYTMDDIQSFLEGHAIDLGAAGQDTQYGFGRLYLGAAPGGTSTFTPTITQTPVTPTYTPTVTQTPVTPTLTSTLTQTPVTPTLTSTLTQTPVTPTFTPTVTQTPVTVTSTPTATATAYAPPGAFGKSAPANASYAFTNPTLSWGASSGADEYEYCIDEINNSACDGSWISTGASTSAGLSGLGNNDPYYWQVRAINPGGTVDANGGTWWTFTARIQIFADVPIDHQFWAEIQAFYDAGITTGCGVDPLVFCPDNTVTRAAMAVFLLRAKYGSTYTPPPATHTFADLPVAGKEWQEAWVDQFYLEGITSGCGISPLIYCPENPVTRAAMAVFILRALYGSGYTPPAATHTFSDMPVLGKEWMEPWVDEFYRLGITGGCGTDPLRYCPENSIKRQGMAAFIVRAFGLPLP